MSGFLSLEDEAGFFVVFFSLGVFAFVFFGSGHVRLFGSLKLVRNSSSFTGTIVDFADAAFFFAEAGAAFFFAEAGVQVYPLPMPFLQRGV